MVKTRCQIFSRVCGYLQPVETWNIGKVEEFKSRSEFQTK
jgi:anaerobic ribonucleoside-triphosphate reductase